MESIQIRCPNCTKLYSVDATEIRTEKPQFECVECHTRFWFRFPPASDLVEVPTYFMDQNAASIKPLPQQDTAAETPKDFACTKCGAKNPKGSDECVRCGLVFEKHRKQMHGPKEMISSTPELKSLWERVLSDYSNETLHETFINLALGQNNLPFASQQYRQILEASPSEEMALKMREKIINVATLTYVPPKREFAAKKRFPLTTIIIAVGLFLMLTGFVVAPLRGVIPIGAVFCTIGFAIVYISKRSL